MADQRSEQTGVSPLEMLNEGQKDDLEAAWDDLKDQRGFRQAASMLGIEEEILKEVLARKLLDESETSVTSRAMNLAVNLRLLTSEAERVQLPKRARGVQVKLLDALADRV